MSIHPSAIIEDGAQIGADVSIGPFCIVGPKVVLGDRVHLKSHVVVTGDTQIGADTTIFPFCCIGEIPQDVKFKGEAAKLVIGEVKMDNNDCLTPALLEEGWILTCQARCVSGKVKIEYPD